MSENTVFDFSISIRDIILAVGGMFLIGKSTLEIHHKMESQGADSTSYVQYGLGYAILQIVILDIIFSIDSILTAVGLTDELVLMYIAVAISMVVMLLFANKIADFIKKHPSIEVLALSFLILIVRLNKRIEDHSREPEYVE